MKLARALILIAELFVIPLTGFGLVSTFMELRGHRVTYCARVDK